MQQKNNIKIVFLLCLFLFVKNNCFGQNEKQIDSVIKVTSIEMYVNPDKVIKVGKEIVSKSNNVNTKIKGYKLISDGYSSKRDYQKSLEYVIKASNLISQSDNKLLKILITNKVGIQYHQLKIYDKSIQYLDEAEKLCIEYPQKDSVRLQLGTNYIVRGFIYKEKLNCDIAIAFFDKGINEIKQSKDEALKSGKLSIAKYNKGNCYILLSEYIAAIKSFEEAIVDAKKTNALSLQAFALKGLAQVYTLEGKYNEAIKFLEAAEVISADVNDLVLNQEIYKGLSENYLAINDMDKYKISQIKYIKTQQRLKESERKSISDLIFEKEKEINTKIENDNPNYYMGFIILLCLFGIVLFLFYYKKTKLAIEKLNLDIKLLQNES